MLIEHVFVTTMEAREALTAAAEFLARKGFVAVGQQAFSMDAAWSSVAMRRGKAKATKAKSIGELPQEVRVHWDRGRVTVAASIEAHHRGFWGGRELPPQAPKAMIHRQLLHAIAEGLEKLLAQRRPMEESEMEWNFVEMRIEGQAEERRRRRRVLTIVAAVIVGTLVGLMVFAIVSSV